MDSDRPVGVSRCHRSQLAPHCAQALVESKTAHVFNLSELISASV